MFRTTFIILISFLVSGKMAPAYIEEPSGPNRDRVYRAAYETVDAFRQECIRRRHWTCIYRLARLSPIKIAKQIPIIEYAIGLYNYDAEEIYVKADPGFPDYYIKLIVLHELGHMLGLDHTPKGIMKAEGGLDGLNFKNAMEEIFQLDAAGN